MVIHDTHVNDVMPNGPASTATERISPSSPCLELLYAQPAGSAIKPAVELVETMRPNVR